MTKVSNNRSSNDVGVYASYVIARELEGAAGIVGVYYLFGETFWGLPLTWIRAVMPFLSRFE
jgi:hypothetical protein